MKKKLSSLYFVPCKSFVSDFFIVEKTFAFYEKFLISEEKTFAIFRFTIFEGRNFRENGQKLRKSRKFLLAKVSAPKVKCLKLNLRQYKSRFSSIVEQVLAFASSINLVREVGNMLLNTLIRTGRSILSLNFKPFVQKTLYSKSFA